MGYPVRDCVCVSPEQLAEAFEREEAALSRKVFSAGVLARMYEGRGLRSAAKCGRERTCVDGVQVLDGDGRMVLVRSPSISRVVCSSLYDYDRALNVARASGLHRCMKREQRVYANLGFGAQRKMLNTFPFTRRERDRKERKWAGRCFR